MDNPAIFFLRQEFEHAWLEFRSYYNLQEDLVEFLGGSHVQRSVHHDDTAESGFWISCESFRIRISEYCVGRNAAWISVFDDDGRRLIEFCAEQRCVANI